MVILLIPFFVFAAAFLLAALSQTSSVQHGSSTWQTFVNTVLHDNIVSQILGLAAKASRSVISHFAAAHLKHLAAYFTATATLWKEIYAAQRAQAQAATAVAGELERAIPREAKKAAAPAMARAKVADRHAMQALGLGHANARNLGRYKADTNARLRADAHAIDVTIPRDLGRIRTREGELERVYEDLRGRTKAIEDGAVKTWDYIRAHPFAFATTAFAGAVAVALGRLGLGGLRCNNFRNLLNRFGCGLGSLLNDVLGLLIAGIALESVCEFLPLLEHAFGAVAGPMVHLLNEVPLGACEQVPEGWATLNVAVGPLPPAQTLGTFPR